MTIDPETLKQRLAVESRLNQTFRKKAAMLLCGGDERSFDSKSFWIGGGFVVEKWERALQGGGSVLQPHGRDCLFDKIEMVAVSHPDYDCQFSFEVCRLKKRGLFWRKRYMYRLCEFNDYDANFNAAAALESYAYVSEKRLAKTLKMLYAIATVNQWGSNDPETVARWAFFGTYEKSIKLMNALKGHGKKQHTKIVSPDIPAKQPQNTKI